MKPVAVYLHKSKIHGVGLFARTNLKKGDLIGVSHAGYGDSWYMTSHGNYNHSESPNCMIETRKSGGADLYRVAINLIIANKEILAGEELTVDYRQQPYLEQPKEGWQN
jgi:SET domain-containing protein